MKQDKKQCNPDFHIKKQNDQQHGSKIIQKLNMTEMYYKGNQEKGQVSIIQEQRKQKLRHIHENLHPSDIKTKSQIFSGISFSKFQAISEPSDIQQKPSIKQQKKQGVFPPKTSSKNIINRVPTSSKIVSSKKIIQQPIQIKEYIDQLKIPNRMSNESSSQQEQTFNFNFLQPQKFLQKFERFSIKKEMLVKINGTHVTSIKKVPLFKSVLTLCFPKSADYQDQAYQLTCLTQKIGKLTHISGSNKKFIIFKEQFLLQLWKDKFLVCGSLPQNLKYFLIYVNKYLINNENQMKNIGQIDYIKIQAQKIIKKLYANINWYVIKNKLKQKQEYNKQKLQHKFKEIENSLQLSQLIQKLKATEHRLRTLLQSQMRNQADIKRKRSNQSKIKSNLQQNKQNQNQDNKILVTPSVQRMLFTMFYFQLDLENIVKKCGICQKNAIDFQQKKMILKGSLNTSDIFKYLELEQFYKNCLLKNSFQSKNNILQSSIKILSSLSYNSYSAPYQALQLISIFKNTLSKQIDNLGNNIQVKLQDHNNEERTLLQFTIYCIIMCDNRSLYSTIETICIFCNKKDDKLKTIYQDSLRTVKILRKAIDFIQNQWEL